MTISFLSYYSGLSDRGVETYVHELANRLVGLGHTVTVYQGGPAVSSTAYQTRPLSSASDLGRLTPDIDWVIPTNGRLQALRAAIWTRIHTKKLLISGQSGLGIDDRFNLYLHPDIFVGLTAFQSSWARRINPRVKIVTIPNGVDPAHFSSAHRPLAHSLTHPVILTVGALTPIKRLPLIIESVAALPQASLIIVGSGPDQANLSALAKHLLPGRHLITSLPHADMASAYASADLFVYACEPYESFGIAILEALSTNLPVVTTPDPIRAEIVGSGGLLASAATSAALSHAISTALAQDWQTAPRHQAQSFTWDKIAKAYHNLFTHHA